MNFIDSSYIILSARISISKIFSQIIDISNVFTIEINIIDIIDLPKREVQFPSCEILRQSEFQPVPAIAVIVFVSLIFPYRWNFDGGPSFIIIIWEFPALVITCLKFPFSA